MERQVILVTGAAGFLGSALTVALSRNHRVIAVDRREPAAGLRAAAPRVPWHPVDIAEAAAVKSAMRDAKRSFGGLDLVVHLAAFYHFGTRWSREYDRTNLQGTLHVLEAAIEQGAGRVIFASSIAATEPPGAGQALTETSPATGWLPYARSKAIGEEMVREASDRLPAIVLRIGGAFSDWCELPPLASLMRMWTGRWPFERLLVGRGRTGIPYIHRRDLVRIVEACVETHPSLGPFQVFLASQHGTVSHGELFAAVRELVAGEAEPEPVTISPRLARTALPLRLGLGYLTGRLPYERPWMLQYLDRPWVVDTSYTCQTLGWSCTPELGILQRMPVLLDHLHRDRRRWEQFNRMRDRRQYAYHE